MTIGSVATGMERILGAIRGTMGASVPLGGRRGKDECWAGVLPPASQTRPGLYLSALAGQTSSARQGAEVKPRSSLRGRGLRAASLSGSTKPPAAPNRLAPDPAGGNMAV